MVINIDSFLDEYEGKKIKNSEDKIDLKLNLDIEKEVSKNVVSLEEKIESKNDLEMLTQIYNEIKKFDSLIPNHFLNIDKTLNSSLNRLLEKYSKDFRNRVKNNLNILKKKIVCNLAEFDKQIQEENYTSCLVIFEKLIKSLTEFPREYLNEKIEISKEIRKRELILDTLIEEYKTHTIKNIKQKINKEITELSKILFPKNTEKIEEKINYLHHLENSIPKFLRSEIIYEKKELTKIILKSEDFLLQDYQRIFETRKIRINQLIEVMHKYSQEMNVTGSLTTYNQIVIEFQLLPEVFFEEKMEIFEKINNLFKFINSLILKGNLKMIFLSYTNSQILENANNYIEHIKKTHMMNSKILEEYKIKIENLPQSLEIEKEELIGKINKLFQIKTTNKKENWNIKENENISEINNFIPNKKMEENVQSSNIKILKKINLYYDKLKQESDITKIKKIHKELLFYMNLTPFSEKTRNEILKKIANVIKQKKYN